MSRSRPRSPLLVLSCLLLSRAAAEDGPGPSVAVVSHVKVLSDRVPDVSSLEDWKRSSITPGMTDGEKALAVWRTVCAFQHQDAPPREYLQSEEVVQDPIKLFNVYGYSFCSVASAGIEALARFAGIEARGRILNAHSVPEVSWDGEWRLLDGSLLNYFPRADGTIAGVDEVMAGIAGWYAANPGFQGNEERLREFMRGGGWRRGPEALSRCPFYDENGWLPAATHGWYSTMQEYDGSAKGIYEYSYSQGYRVNIQLRPGERWTRSWSNRGLHVNRLEGDAPGCLALRPGEGALRYAPAQGDLSNGRVGNGLHEYRPPLDDPAFLLGALGAENLAARREGGGAALEAKDPARPAALTLRMPSSYVYLDGKLELETAIGERGFGEKAIGERGSVAVLFSENHGLDWREAARISSPGRATVDLGRLVLRRYDYRLKLVLEGPATRIRALRIAHDIQHSQRPLPALAKGENRIAFRAGPPEGTITIEGSTDLSHRGKQLVYTDFHARAMGLGPPNLFIDRSGAGEVTFPVETPGDLARLRFGAHYRARDARDGWDYQVSFDGGKSFRTAARAAGPTPGSCRYIAFEEVPAGTRKALVRFSGTSRNATGIFNFRIDADYLEPGGGFRPVKVTYRWEEEGRPREHVHVARKPEESYVIACEARPVMGSIVLELLD